MAGLCRCATHGLLVLVALLVLLVLLLVLVLLVRFHTSEGSPAGGGREMRER